MRMSKEQLIKEIDRLTNRNSVLEEINTKLRANMDSINKISTH